MSDEHTHDSSAGETLEGEGFSDARRRLGRRAQCYATPAVASCS